MRAATFRLWVLALALPFSALADKNDKANKKPKEDVEQIGERDVGKGLNFYSLEKEIALGKQLAEEVERSAKIVDDPIVAEYVNRVGQNLVRNSDTKVPFTIKIIDDQQVNAFALPGGFLFVNTGLIELAETEGEMAGVLAHEIAHVAARHGTRQASRGQLVNLASLPLIFAGGWTGFAVRQAASFAIPLTFLEFSRGFEAEADLLGIQYLYKAGYDPTSFTEFFEKMQALEKRKPGALAKVFRSHPMTDDRIEAAQKATERILPSRPEYVVSTSEFDDVKNRLRERLVSARAGEPEREGPELRRTGQTRTDRIEPTDPSTPGSAEGEEDGPPQLKRAPGTEEDERPQLKRPESQTRSERVEPTEPAAPATTTEDTEDDERPRLRRSK